MIAFVEEPRADRGIPGVGEHGAVARGVGDRSGPLGLKVVKPNVGSSDVDVIGPNGEYIAVGGRAKAKNLGKLREKLGILKYAADEKKVRSQAYFEKGTPQSALDVAGDVLGEENVFTFER
jgi:hypothetical protein